jgi:chitinase
MIATIVFWAFLAVNGTQVMKRPDNYKDIPGTPKTELNPKINIIHKRANNKVSFAYFTNWGIYGANFRESLIDSR